VIFTNAFAFILKPVFMHRYILRYWKLEAF